MDIITSLFGGFAGYAAIAIAAVAAALGYIAKTKRDQRKTDEAEFKQNDAERIVRENRAVVEHESSVLKGTEDAKSQVDTMPASDVDRELRDNWTRDAERDPNK